VESLAVRPIPRATEALRLLASYVRSLPRNSVVTTPQLRSLMASHVQDLIAATLDQAAPRRVQHGAIAAARLDAALQYMSTHYQKADLTVEKVARRLEISPRYLQHLLERSGMSFTERINDLRLQHAFRILTQSQNRAHRIAHIALEAGFSDISHFNRLFRCRFGDTPTGVRNQKDRSSSAQIDVSSM
jgi:AraC-like DNA-binding protein